MEVVNTPPIELILFNIILLCILYNKYMIYSQIMSLNPRERTGFHPSGHPQPSHRLPVLFGFLLVLSSKFHIFGTKL